MLVLVKVCSHPLLIGIVGLCSSLDGRMEDKEAQGSKCTFEIGKRPDAFTVVGEGHM